MIFLPVHSSFLKYTSQFFLQFLFWRIWPQYLGTHTNSVTLKYVWVQHWNLTFLLLYMQNIYIERERERVCTVSTRLWLRIPLRPTFYMESKNLSSIWISYISTNSATRPWLPHKIQFETLVWRVMKGLARN